MCHGSGRVIILYLVIIYLCGISLLCDCADDCTKGLRPPLLLTKYHVDMDDDGHDRSSGGSGSGGFEGKDSESKTRSFRVDSLLPKVAITTTLFFHPVLVLFVHLFSPFLVVCYDDSSHI